MPVNTDTLRGEILEDAKTHLTGHHDLDVHFDGSVFRVACFDCDAEWTVTIPQAGTYVYTEVTEGDRSDQITTH